jgi:DNA-binding NtrC family response regulator
LKNKVRINEYGFVGSSLAMSELYAKIDCVAKSKAPVFIQGETGTGKELCAQAVHAKSDRCQKPFVAVNCGAIPHELMESEMFGHLKGSFTGAIANRAGAAKMADGGTLFLDEICEMPLDLQTRLLRFLQTGLIQAVGASRPEKVDVRIICATNKDPKAEVDAGKLRQDLYFRLFVLPLALPPLRLRGMDVIDIAEFFLCAYSSEENKEFDSFSDDALRVIEDYDWPGNVRELQNVLRQAVVMNAGKQVEMAMLGDLVDEIDPRPSLDVTAYIGGNNLPTRPAQFKSRQLWQIERDAIEAAIVASDGSIPRAAEQLGVSPSTLYRKRDNWNGSRQSAFK